MTKLLLCLLAFGLVRAAQAQHVTGTSTARQVVWTPAVPRPTAPARIEIRNITFVDDNGNRKIDARESFTVGYTLCNTGVGDAYQIQPRIAMSPTVGRISIPEAVVIRQLNAGDTVQVTQRGYAAQEIQDGPLTLTLSATEGNGFVPVPQSLTVETYAFRPPQVLVAETRFSSQGGGVPKVGEVITLQMLIENRSETPATKVLAQFTLPDNIFPGDETKILIGTLKPGEQRVVAFPFFTNQKYMATRIPIDVSLTESYGRYAQGTTATVDLAQSLAKGTSTVITGVAAAPVQMGGRSLYSDVDLDIPQTKRVQPHVFALVIGNEHYQDNSREADVPFARSDASVFRDYLVRTAGIPEANIILLQDATKAAMENAIGRIAGLAETYPGREKQPAEIVFYYAGHGLCDDQKNGYLIPVDVPGTQVQQGIRSSDVYYRLAASRAGRVTVFLDACFSGGARGQQLLAARAVKIEPNKDLIAGNTVIFAAAQNNQSAMAYTDKQHGMFTYFLLRKLKETQGGVSYAELGSYLRDEVAHNALRINDASQTPDVLVSPQVETLWGDWKLTNGGL